MNARPEAGSTAGERTGPAEAPHAATKAGSIFRIRNFRLFFVGQMVSNSGTWLQNVAQAVLVKRLTGSSFMVGVTNAALFVPVLVLALVGGRLADAVDRRRLLVATQVLAMAATGTLAALAGVGEATVGAVSAVAILIGIQYAVSIPTMGAMLPALVPRDRLGEAVGLNSVTYNLARVVGPIAATAAIGALGFGWAFGLNSLSFVALIVALLLLRLEPGGPVRRADRSVREVLRYALRDRRVLTMLAGVAAVSVAADPVVTLSPAFAHDVFGRATEQAGWVVSAFGIGAISSAVLLARMFRRPREQRFRSVRWTMLVMAAGLVAFAWVPSWWGALVALVVGGGGYLTSSTAWTAGLQEEVPDRMRGRIMALWTLAFLGSRPIASLIDGAAADALGPRVAVLLVLLPLVAVAAIGPRAAAAEADTAR